LHVAALRLQFKSPLQCKLRLQFMARLQSKSQLFLDPELPAIAPPRFLLQ
jgi:hypothetical protein